MSGFKLIAIIPLRDCSSDFRKNLQPCSIYKFYNNYKVELEKNGSSVKSFEELPAKVSKDLFKLKNSIDLNISIAVGKNGTGKSTLFELLYYLIYSISVKKKHDDNLLITPYSEELIELHDDLLHDWQFFERQIDLSKKIKTNAKLTEEEAEFLAENGNDLVNLSFELVQKHNIRKDKKSFDNPEKLYFWLKQELINKQLRLRFEIDKVEKVSEENIESGLYVSVLYSIGSQLFELEYSGGGFRQYEHTKIKTPIAQNMEEFDLTSFPYTVSVNYSHHSLNSDTIGNWISKLFHKNDAYTTPLVINPMRENGNFDINKELALSKERLMANVVFDLVKGEATLLKGKYKIKEFIFRPKSPLAYPLGYDDEFINTLVSGELLKNVGIKRVQNNPYWEQAISYLENKLMRVKNVYKFLIQKIKADGLDEDGALKKFVAEDNSHITKKIRQTINFLRITKDHPNFWKNGEGTLETSLSPEGMLEWLKLFNQDLEEQTPSELIELALPGFFRIEFEIENYKDEHFPFDRLSSGERQSILNINSILYHLYNLQSIHHQDKVDIISEAVNRIEYSHVNVLLDEVELYYHPEMQRSMIYDLVSAFEKIRKKEQIGIESINLCVLTHSPFILSDLPSENTLRLDLDIETQMSTPMETSEETFGANIYNMLTHDFFLQQGFIGEFAKKTIENLLEELYNLNEHEQKISASTYLEYRNRIEMIGERIISVRLMDILNEIPTEYSQLEKDIYEAEKRVEQLKNKRL